MGQELEGDVPHKGLTSFSDERDWDTFHLFRCCWKFLGHGES